MSHRISLIALLGVSLAITVACTNKKSSQSAGQYWVEAAR
jgi:hypothetical protein